MPERERVQLQAVSSQAGKPIATAIVHSCSAEISAQQVVRMQV
jgi:hypothetical protein